MNAILKSDFYRLGKSALLYSLLALTLIIGFALTLTIRQDIRLGISVFGNLTAFRNVEDIVRIGIQFYRGLGILIAIIISVFIGQEHSWGTWQHKWIATHNRPGIYLSKVVSSVVISVAIFLLFQLITLVSAGRLANLDQSYWVMLINGVFIYAALGAVLCLISMLLRSNTAGTIISLIYVLFAETAASLIQSVGQLSYVTTRASNWVTRHTLYGMASTLNETTATAATIWPTIMSAVTIIALATAIGILVFNRREL